MRGQIKSLQLEYKNETKEREVDARNLKACLSSSGIEYYSSESPLFVKVGSLRTIELNRPRYIFQTQASVDSSPGICENWKGPFL